MRLWIVVVMILAMLGCQSQNKKSKTQTDAEASYEIALNNFKVGCAYINDHNYIEAIDYIKRAIEIDDHNFRYHHWLGLAYMLNGQASEALTEFQNALTINPESTDSLNNMAIIEIEQGNYDQAYQYLKKVIQDSSYGQPQLAYFNLGLCLLNQEKYDQAVAAFEQAVRVEPQFFRAYLQIAEIHAVNGEFNKALEYYLKAEPGFNNDAQVLFKIGHAYFKNRDFEHAKKYLTQVSILFPPPELDRPTQEMLSIIEREYR
ncbi:MAG: tetratricopeptide repeat protein [Acidobacteria bacterium]|nr:tetratricopeptide repeat protein [Acidobacteriota bacterium]